MLADYVKAFNDAATVKGRLAVLEDIWTQQLEALCKIFANVPRDADPTEQPLLIDVRDHYGDYEILTRAKKLLQDRIKAEKLEYFSGFEAYFAKACYYVMTQYLAKYKEFKEHQGKFYYYGVLCDERMQQNIPLPEEIPPHDCVKSIYNVFQDMYRRLDAAKWGEAHKLIKSYQDRLRYSKCTPEETQLLQALLSHFQGHLYMHATRYKRAQPFLLKAIQFFETLQAPKPHFLAASKHLLAINFLNAGKRTEGFELLNSVKELTRNSTELNLKLIRTKAIVTTAKDTALFNPGKAQHIMNTIPENIDFPSKIEIFIHQNQARMHLYSKEPEKALAALTQMEAALNTAPSAEETRFERLRFYDTKAEALLHNFQTRDTANLEAARKQLLKAKTHNNLLRGKLWECSANIMEGYIENDRRMIRDGIFGLRDAGMQSRYHWYQEIFK